MSDKKYTIDDLLHLANLGRFGSSDMNALAAKAFIHLRSLQLENIELRKRIEEKDIQIFHVQAQQNENDTK
jgi:hypothetical protein